MRWRGEGGGEGGEGGEEGGEGEREREGRMGVARGFVMRRMDSY